MKLGQLFDSYAGQRWEKYEDPTGKQCWVTRSLNEAPHRYKITASIPLKLVTAKKLEPSDVLVEVRFREVCLARPVLEVFSFEKEIILPGQQHHLIKIGGASNFQIAKQLVEFLMSTKGQGSIKDLSPLIQFKNPSKTGLRHQH